MRHLDKQTNVDPKEGLNSPEEKYQKQPKSRGQARMSNKDNRSYRSEARSDNPNAKEKGRARYGRSPDLLPRQNISSRQANNRYSHHTHAKAAGDTSVSSRRVKTRSRNSLFSSFILYSLRLLIMGVGISALAGTVLSNLNPTIRTPSKGMPIMSMQMMPGKQAIPPMATAGELKLSQEIMPLKTVVQQLAAQNPKLLPGVFFVDLDTGNYVDLNGETTFSSASMIKFPVLVAFFQDVDAGKIRLDEQLTVKKELIGGGSGDLQYKPVGTKLSTLSTAIKMITISDNTATNMLSDRLGGAKALNQRFSSWGLTVTEIHNPLPDLSGTNTTSPRDLAQLMAAVEQGNLISVKSRDRLLDIMRHTAIVTLLPKGLGEGATIAHKTGDIGSMVGDVGLVDMPSGKRYVAVAMVKRPHNNEQAKELIRSISRAAYQQFSQPASFVTNTPVKKAGGEV